MQEFNRNGAAGAPVFSRTRGTETLRLNMIENIGQFELSGRTMTLRSRAADGAQRPAAV